MNNIPPRLRKQLAADPFYKKCAREGLHGHECGGRITWEHAIMFAGKQVQERFAILPICAKGHEVDSYQDGGDLDKEVHLWLALSRATDDELRAISRTIDYRQKLNRLNVQYGIYAGACVREPATIPLFWFRSSYSLA